MNTTAKLPGLTMFFPCYNEQANVAQVIQEALAVAQANADQYDVVIVDDGSKDETSAIVQKIAAQNPNVRLVRHTVNRGYGEALKSGFASAKYPWVFYSDGDRQFDLSEFPKLTSALANAGIVSGYRIVRADPWHRILNAKIFELALGVFMGLHVRDVDCAFKLYKREIFDKIQLKCSGALIDAEVLSKAQKKGYSIATVGVSHRPRVAGTQTGAKLHVIFRAMKEFAFLWWDLHLRTR